MSQHNILRGANFSVFKETTTKDPIHILKAVLEDAHENKKEVWIPQGFIDQLGFITDDKTNRVITQYGLTAAYHPQCGLDQGGVECPLLWRIAYDSLLCMLEKLDSGYIMSSGLGPDQPVPAISDLVFVDDTTPIARNLQKMRLLADISQEFFDLHGVEINAKKTELIAINKTEDGSVRLGGGDINPHPPDQPSQTLGIWISADGTVKPTHAIVHKEVESVCSKLEDKVVTDKHAVFIINSVLIPRILYRLTINIISDQEITAIVHRYRAGIRRKVGLPQSIPNSILHHARIYGLRDLADALAEEQISTLWLRVNDKGLIGTITHCRSHALKTQHIYRSHLSLTQQ
ncbi:hypothetical protein BGX23_001831 [Mortierella sp. AD031]|nr:hypothetical protein BGX23_001831 [Mortierella sp. AD031]